MLRFTWRELKKVSGIETETDAVFSDDAVVGFKLDCVRTSFHDAAVVVQGEGRNLSRAARVGQT